MVFSERGIVMNKITSKPKGIQTRWIEYDGWNIIRKPIKMRKYFKQVQALNKRFRASCFKWYDEYENEYTYALWVFELVENKYKQRVHAGHCGRFTKGSLKKYLKQLPQELEMLRKFSEAKKNGNSSSNNIDLQLYGGCSNGNNFQEEIMREIKSAGRICLEATTEREKEYQADLDHYDVGIGIHSTSYELTKKRLFRLAEIEDKLEHWLNLLSQDGKNTKLQVKNEIKAVLEETKK